jgi:hypothetical protein
MPSWELTKLILGADRIRFLEDYAISFPSKGDYPEMFIDKGGITFRVTLEETEAGDSCFLPCIEESNTPLTGRQLREFSGPFGAVEQTESVVLVGDEAAEAVPTQLLALSQNAPVNIGLGTQMVKYFTVQALDEKQVD